MKSTILDAKKFLYGELRSSGTLADVRINWGVAAEEGIREAIRIGDATSAQDWTHLGRALPRREEKYRLRLHAAVVREGPDAALTAEERLWSIVEVIDTIARERMTSATIAGFCKPAAIATVTQTIDGTAGGYIAEATIEIECEARY